MEASVLIEQAKRFMVEHETIRVGRNTIVVSALVAATETVEDADLTLRQMFETAQNFALATPCEAPHNPPIVGGSWQDFMRSFISKLLVQMMLRDKKIAALEKQRRRI